MKRLLILSLLMLSQISFAAELGAYNRVWQGFRLDSNSRDFLKALPPFMQGAWTTYQGALNNYLVAIPPANKPEFVPDEFALVSVESEEAYKQIRATPAGVAYGESHWTIFAKDKSASAVAGSDLNRLENNKTYDVLGTPVDWRAGHSVFFLALKKVGQTSADFLAHLGRHVQDFRAAAKDRGLKGYIIIANENYEVAYLNWNSKAEMDSALATPEAQAAVKDAGAFMDILMWTDAEVYNQKSVAPGHFYNTDQDSGAGMDWTQGYASRATLQYGRDESDWGWARVKDCGSVDSSEQGTTAIRCTGVNKILGPGGGGEFYADYACTVPFREISPGVFHALVDQMECN